MHSSYSVLYGQSIQMKLCFSNININIVQDLANLPIVHDSYMLEKAKRGLGPLMRLDVCHWCISVLVFWGGIDKVVSSIVTQSGQTFSPCFWCVGNSENKNSTSPQRELLLRHWKLCINIYWVQEFMHKKMFEEQLGKCTILPPIIKPKLPSAYNYVILVCQTCLLATPNVKRSIAYPENEGALSSCTRAEVGEFVSTDQFICKTPGWLPEGYGYESKD